MMTSSFVIDSKSGVANRNRNVHYNLLIIAIVIRKFTMILFTHYQVVRRRRVGQFS